VALLVTAPVPFWVSRQLLSGALRDPSRANAVTFWSSMHMAIATCAISLSLLADMFIHDRPIQAQWLGVYGTTLTIFLGWLARAVGANTKTAPTQPAVSQGGASAAVPASSSEDPTHRSAA
jgi:1,4-dihydroxy-2-naphthoate octaprenyltransferase